MALLKKTLLAALFLGALLLALALLFPGQWLSMPLSAYAVVAFLLFTTFALKLFTKAETYYLFSMLRTQRFAGLIERISRTRLWDLLADIGIIIGFGAIAVDYLFGRGKGIGKRILLGISSVALLSVLFFFVFGLFFAAPTPDLLLVLILFSLSFAFGGLMLFAVAALVLQGVDIISKILIGKTPCPGVAPIIPGVQVPNVPASFTPPFYIWIAFVIILVVHEFSHGALIKRAQARIKSVGLLLAGIFPVGAFVEPDEDELKAKPARQQLRVYAVGPAANLYSIPVFIALLFLGVLAFSPIFGPFMDSSEKSIALESVTVSNVSDDYDICGNIVRSPAKGEIEEGWVLLRYNGVDLNTLHDFREAFAVQDRNVSMLFRTQQGALVEKDLERNEYGMIGIGMDIDYVPGKGPAPEYVYLLLAISVLATFFGWLLLISFAIAVVNFLPIDPFDGGRIAKIILLPYFGFLKMNRRDTEKFIGRLFLWIVAGLLLLNALPLLL